MNVAIIGEYYKTAESAKEAFDKMPEGKRHSYSIVEFDNAFMIVSDQQLKRIEEKQNEESN